MTTRLKSFSRSHHLSRPLRSNMSLDDKTLACKTINSPGDDIRYPNSGTDWNVKLLNRFQSFQSINIRLLTNGPSCVPSQWPQYANSLPTLVSFCDKKFHVNAISRPNPFVLNLSSDNLLGDLTRRLKRNRSREFLEN